MKIFLKNRYRGALTNEQWLAHGEHDANELPNGLAQYLVDNGHATVIEADSKPIPPNRIDTRKIVARERADKTLTPDEIEDVRMQTEEDVEADELKVEYETLAGEAPPWNIKLETLRARVEELRDED